MYQYYLPEQYSHSQLQHFQWMEGPFLQVPLSHLRHQILLKLNQGNGKSVKDSINVQNNLAITFMYQNEIICFYRFDL